jgi:hypothetical protein
MSQRANLSGKKINNKETERIILNKISICQTHWCSKLDKDHIMALKFEGTTTRNQYNEVSSREL